MEPVQYTVLLNAVQLAAARTALLLGGAPARCSFFEEDEVQRTPAHILRTVFGYTSFRPMQEAVIQNVLDGRDTLAVMPTGGGKSLCYQIPALIMEGLTVVVSPLIALMQDQVSQLEAAGVPAACLNSSMDWDSWRGAADRIREGKIRLLYVSPEGLCTQRMGELLHSGGVDVRCLTIDEAHCISEWGHDFRPDYLGIALVRRQFPGAVCLALTATATQAVRNDIVRLLGMEEPEVLVSSFNRKNIFLEVRRRDDTEAQVLGFIAEHPGESGIIYCFSRKQVDSLAKTLLKKGVSALPYHAGLPDEERRENQDSFLRGKADIMVATLAFGMGINKPDVRFVIHASLPKSIEQYYQEIGRAGRDGQSAHALLLHSPADAVRIRRFIAESPEADKASKLLDDMVAFAQGRECRRSHLLAYFGEHDFERGQKECCCDICAHGTEPVPLVDMTVPSQKLMSCILRTKERYGISYIADILTGARTQRIIENGHTALSTWGIGKELKKSGWIELCSLLVSEGYLFKSGDYGILYVTASGRDALSARAQIRLPAQLVPGTARTRKRTVERPQRVVPGDGESSRIYEELRKWRRRTADEMNVPPYVIFGDRTLMDISTRKPGSQAQLRECYGIGESKADRFGSSILRIVSGI